MPPDLRRLRDSSLPVYSILFLSVAYLSILAFSIHEGVFYAGDQGLKSLVVQQIAQGYGFKYLHLPQPEWVQSIWKAGFTPLRPPSFYNSPDGYMIVFPPGFQIISAWMYEKWGTAGLYVIPMSGTAILLGWFVLVLRRCGVKPLMVAFGVFILVFCSPLALYGIMFWEHLPAALLLFAGVVFLVRPPEKTPAALALGAVSGLAVFLRPEALVMNFLYVLAALYLYFWNERSAQNKRVNGKSWAIPAAFAAGIAVPVLAFFIFNKVEYGSLMGIHGRQVFIDTDPGTRMSWSHGLDNLWQNNYISTRYFLFTLLLIPLLIYGIARWKTSDPRPVTLAAVVILFSVLTPWVLPNNGIIQWGARYFLSIIPVTLVALLLAERQWNLFAGRRIPMWLLCLLIVGTGYSFYHNTHGGGFKEVRWRYNQRLTNAYRLIDSKPGNVVIVSHYWMINDFAYLFDKGYFFAASNNDSLSRLLPLLKKNGVRQYIYIFDPRGPTLPTMLEDSSTRRWWDAKKQKIWIKDDYAAKVYTIR